MSFQERFNITNIYKNDFNSKKQVYKYIYTFEDEFYYSDVYNFCKKYIQELKHICSNSFTSISLYALQNEFKHQIFYISFDAAGNTIKKEKFNEDTTIFSPFDIYILVETFNIPLNFSQNTVEKVLRPTFKLKREHRPRTFDGTIEKKLYFYTTSIEHGNKTPEEIYNLSLPYIINFQCIYKKDTIDAIPITKSTYEITVTGITVNKTLYYCEIDTEGDTLNERRIYQNINPRLQTPYKILLTITLIHDPQMLVVEDDDTQLELDTLEFRLRSLNQQLETFRNRINIRKSNTKCMKEETCCVCLSNPSNILFPDCGHLCICEKCDNNITNLEEEQLKCPLCRTIATLPRITI